MNPTTPDPSRMGWEQCTAAGSEDAEIHVWMKLSVREKLAAVEAMADLSRTFIEHRRRLGLPYFDPITRELVAPSKPPSETAA